MVSRTILHRAASMMGTDWRSRSCRLALMFQPHESLPSQKALAPGGLHRLGRGRRTGRRLKGNANDHLQNSCEMDAQGRSAARRSPGRAAPPRT